MTCLYEAHQLQRDLQRDGDEVVEEDDEGDEAEAGLDQLLANRRGRVREIWRISNFFFSV